MTTNRQRLLKLLTGDPELVERLLCVAEPESPPGPVTTSGEAYALVEAHLVGHKRERLVVAALDRRRKVIAVETLTIGSDAATIIDPKQIFSWALRQGRNGASAIIIAHNHPSGDPTPSYQDREVTLRVKRAGTLLGIPLLDHIVVGANGYTSLAETEDHF